MTAINVIALPNNVYVFREPILVRELNTFAQEYDYPDMYQDGDKRALVITNMHIAYEFSRKFHTSFQIEHIWRLAGLLQFFQLGKSFLLITKDGTVKEK